MPSYTAIHTPTMGKRKRDIGQFEEDVIPKDVNPNSYLSSMGNFNPNRPVLKPRLAASKYISNIHHDSKRQRVTTLTFANSLDTEPPLPVTPLPPQLEPDSPTSVAMELDHSPNSTPFAVPRRDLTSIQTRPPKAFSVSTSELSACHICFRKPSVRSDLDSYTNCERCDLRTCYICVRACGGPDVRLPVSILGESRDPVKDWETMKELWKQHRSVICSRCCIEMGANGEVRCLGCTKGEGMG